MSRKPLNERVLSAAREARDHAAGKIKLAERLPVIPDDVDVRRSARVEVRLLPRLLLLSELVS